MRRGVEAVAALERQESGRGASWALLAALLWSSCGAVNPRPQPTRGAPIAIPAMPGTHLLFHQGRVVLHEGAAATVVQESSSTAGSTITSALDLEESMACVVFEHEVAFVDLTSSRITAWRAHPVGAGVRGASIHGRSVALWSDAEVALVDESGSSEILALSGMLRASGVDYPDFVFREGPDRLVILASKAQTAMSDGVTQILRLDRSAGPWKRQQLSSVEGLTSVQRVVADGGALFVAGIFEKSQLASGGPGRLWQDALVFRVDLMSLEAVEVMRSPRQARETVIRDLAVGSDSVSLLYRDGLVEVYRRTAAERATTPVFDRSYPGAESIAWVSENELLVVVEGRAEPLRFR